MLDPYVIDTLLPDLVGHDRRPGAFLVYLFLWRHTHDHATPVSMSLREIAEGTGEVVGKETLLQIGSAFDPAGRSLSGTNPDSIWIRDLRSRASSFRQVLSTDGPPLLSVDGRLLVTQAEQGQGQLEQDQDQDERDDREEQPPQQAGSGGRRRRAVRRGRRVATVRRGVGHEPPNRRWVPTGSSADSPCSSRSRARCSRQLS